jgi:hypothetical protein
MPRQSSRQPPRRQGITIDFEIHYWLNAPGSVIFILRNGDINGARAGRNGAGRGGTIC